MEKETSRKLIVIDDEYLAVRGIETMIRKMDVPYVFAGSAQDGVSGLKLIEEVRPDLVITDIRMPGLSGLDLIAEARKKFPDMIFSLISAYREFEYARQGLELGAVSYIDKPITRDKLQLLFARTDRLLDKRRRAESQDDRVSALAEIRFSRNIFIEKVDSSDLESWDRELEHFRAILQDYHFTAEDYKNECYHLVRSVEEAYYEKWKIYDPDSHLALYQNVEKLESKEALDEYTEMILDHVREKISAHKMGTSYRVVTRVINYINEHYAEEISLNELAEKEGVSVTYLSILIKDEVGISFIRYLTNVRMEHAKELLKRGYRVNEVSGMVGYNNYRYFTNVFKKETGLTPMEYKAKTGKK